MEVTGFTIDRTAGSLGRRKGRTDRLGGECGNCFRVRRPTSKQQLTTLSDFRMLRFQKCECAAMNPLHLTHKVLSTTDLVIIGLYFCVIFAIGFYFSRKERTSSEYFLAGRNVGWFAIGASLFVSNISTEHFIGLAGSGASSGLAVGHFEWLACFMLLLLGWVFVPFYLRSNVFTMP